MQKIGDSSHELVNYAVRDSLNTIKEAHVRLHLLTGASTTAAALASQIELCDVLLVEISGIQTSLARDIRNARKMPQALGHAGLNA